MDKHVYKNVADKTKKYYEWTILQKIKPYFKNKESKSLKAFDIEDFYLYLREEDTLSSISINHVHLSLRAMLNKAVVWEFIEKNPMLTVTPPKKNKTKANYS